MHLKTCNVNSAFAQLVNGINRTDGVGLSLAVTRTNSRYGEVLRVDEPVTLTYTHPKERVLFNKARDCNPFFHLYESLWMLAGREDVAPLAYYNGRMREFSDDGLTLNGAYGHRWRWARSGNNLRHHTDQLVMIVEHLRASPNSRRAVLSMWNVEDDLIHVDTSKDVCCNLNVCFRLRKTGNLNFKAVDIGDVSAPDEYTLDMTVFNRSNDLVWGMLGANAVHFSVLQEYVAARLGAEVGVYNQITNDLHVYTNTWEPTRWLVERYVDPYQIYLPTSIVPLVSDPDTFDKELPGFADLHSEPTALSYPNGAHVYTEPFLQTVANPMLMAYHCYKAGYWMMTGDWLSRIKADDWRAVSVEWIHKRAVKAGKDNELWRHL